MRPIVPLPSKGVKTKRDDSESLRVSTSIATASPSFSILKSALVRESSSLLSSPNVDRDFQIEQDVESADEDMLNDSDSTPVRLGPPVHASHEEKVQFYWRLCYGEFDEPKPGDGVWSASRQPPIKSCFSSRKRGTPSSFAALQSSASVPVTPNFKVFTPVHSVPVSASEGAVKNVKFGFSSAVEFDENKPISEMTPLPSDVAQEYFPMDSSLDSRDSSEAKHKETAYNISVLAEWEDDFDSFLVDDDDGENIELTPTSSQSLLISLQEDDSSERSGDLRLSQRRRRRSSGVRELRRTSEYFCREGGSLLETVMDTDTEYKSEPQILRDKDVNGIVTESLTFRSPPDSFVASLPIKSSNDKHIHSSSSMLRPPSLGTSTISPTYTSSSPSVNSSFCTIDTPNHAQSSSSTVLKSVHSDGGATFRSPIQDSHKKTNIVPHQLESVLKLAQTHHPPKNLSIKSEILQSDGDLKGWKMQSLLYNLSREDFMVTHMHYLMEASYSSLHGQDLDISMTSSSYDTNESHSISKTMKTSSITLMNVLLDVAQSVEDLILLDIDSKSLVADVFEECVLMLEQQLKPPTDIQAPATRNIFELLLRSFNHQELFTINSIFLRLALQEWRKMELQVLWGAPSWLMPIIDENMQESHRSKQVYISDAANRSLPYGTHAKKNRMIRNKFYHELQQVDSLRHTIESEKRSLNHLKTELDYWQRLCSIESSITDRLIENLVLKNILPFEASSLSANNIDVIFRHLDSSLTTLRIIQQTGSSPDSLGIMKNPAIVIHRQKGITMVEGEGQRRQWVPNVPSKSVAYKLYCTILDHSLFLPFLRNCYTQDNSIVWLSIVSDILDRLQLLLYDVLELGKYYRVKVGDTVTKNGNLELHVIINLGAYITIGVRFTYNLSMSWTMYHMAPSQVYLSGITGEPAVPLTTLQRTLERKLLYEAPISNAFLLKRLCSLLVETVQGRSMNTK